ncbi:uncharacterized protein [Callorhinus ursinus]|uniref:uncharacterized protein isoform X4 n=1 Tax=Callorhinus ursinus TaxID=34884 RepID=UPI003CD01D2E
MTFLKISFVNAAPVFSCHLLLQHFYDEVRGFYKNKFPGGPENPEVLITLGPHFCKATQLELPQRKSFPSGYINRKKPRDLLGSRSSVSEEKTSWMNAGRVRVKLGVDDTRKESSPAWHYVGSQLSGNAECGLQSLPGARGPIGSNMGIKSGQQEGTINLMLSFDCVKTQGT